MRNTTITRDILATYTARRQMPISSRREGRVWAEEMVEVALALGDLTGRLETLFAVPPLTIYQAIILDPQTGARTLFELDRITGKPRYVDTLD
ncbi:MAG TPA: hypothetical protein VMT72_05500 [Pseudolabrys sp.]|nr:hypothetical protein [Pseudolabrys sp.]